jgi:hypothetical protein
MYNWDEKGFIIGLTTRTQRIMSLEAFRSGRIQFALTDGNREFVTLLACICADGTKIPVGLIYKGESHDLQDTWVEEVDDSDDVYFAASENGWTCNSLGLQWLEKIFDPHTKEKAGRGRRLLIVDRHSSHVNMAFLDWADRHRIIVAVMPAHSTHRLQPLDVGLFAPLSTAYTKQLNALAFKSLGMVSMTKRFFYPLFRDAFNEAFTQKNIEHAFEKTGIWPYDPEQVLSKLRKPEPALEPIPEPIPANKTLETPKTCRSVRRVQKAYKNNRRESTLDLIFHANLHLAAQQSINMHIISGLSEALRLERKRRKKGRKLNLQGKDDHGPQFWSPTQVRAARAFQAQKDADEQANRERIADNKAKAIANKAQKEALKAERALQAEARRQHALEEKARKAEEKAQKQAAKQAEKAAKKAAAEAKKAAKLASLSVPKPKTLAKAKKQVVVDETGDGEEGAGRSVKSVVVSKTRTRTVRMPQRYKKNT